MSYIAGFSDNQLIGVDDLNSITKRLVTNGVGYTLSNSGSIAVTQLNGYTAAIATDGVVGESDSSLKVTKSGSTVTVDCGLAFFADGSFIEVTEKEELSFSGSDGYVYAINDVALGVHEIRVGTAYPEGDFVMLASISGGVLTDARKYAKGKLPSYASYSGYPLFVSKKVVCTGPSQYEREGSFTVDLGGHALNGIVIRPKASGEPYCTCICFFDENKKVVSYLSKPNSWDKIYTKCLYQYFYNTVRFASLKFSCTASGILTVNVLSSTGLSGEPDTVTETIEFIVF